MEHKRFYICRHKRKQVLCGRNGGTNISFLFRPKPTSLKNLIVKLPGYARAYQNANFMFCNYSKLCHDYFPLAVKNCHAQEKKDKNI